MSDITLKKKKKKKKKKYVVVSLSQETEQAETID